MPLVRSEGPIFPCYFCLLGLFPRPSANTRSASFATVFSVYLLAEVLNMSPPRPPNSASKRLMISSGTFIMQKPSSSRFTWASTSFCSYEASLCWSCICTAVELCPALCCWTSSSSTLADFGYIYFLWCLNCCYSKSGFSYCFARSIRCGTLPWDMDPDFWLSMTVSTSFVRAKVASLLAELVRAVPAGLLMLPGRP